MIYFKVPVEQYANLAAYYDRQLDSIAEKITRDMVSGNILGATKSFQMGVAVEELHIHYRRMASCIGDTRFCNIDL